MGLCIVGGLGHSYGSVLYDVVVYGDLDVENDTIINGTLTTEKILFEDNTTHHTIEDNSTCVITTAGSTTFNVCE